MLIIKMLKLAEVGGSWSEDSSTKVSERPYHKNKLKAKGLVAWLKW
jgi:hypothetical protein